MQPAVIRHRHAIPPDPLTPQPDVSLAFPAPEEGAPRQHVRLSELAQTSFTLDKRVHYALGYAPAAQTVAFLRRAGYSAYQELPGAPPLLQRHAAVNALLDLGNLALREGSAPGTLLLEVAEHVRPYPPPRDPVLGLVAPHSHYCVVCGGPSPHKILCDPCLSASEWLPAAFCNACGDPHSYQSNAQVYCPSCWLAISGQLRAGQPVALRCEQLVALGYWQAERCCPECHAGEEAQLYGLQLAGGQAALLCCNAAHAAISLVSRISLRLVGIGAEEERDS